MLVDTIAFALLLGLYLAIAAGEIAQDLYDRYQAQHAPPPPPMLDLKRLENLQNILPETANKPAASVTCINAVPRKRVMFSNAPGSGWSMQK